MKSRSVFRLLLPSLLLLLPSLLPAQEALTPDAIKELIVREVDGRRCPAIVVGIVDAKGRKVIAHGTANNAGLKPDGSTLFDVGMITKLFTTLILADMAEKGEAKLEDPVSKYLSGTCTIPSRDDKQITLYDLATHTSGLPSVPGNLTPSDVANPYADYPSEKMCAYLSTYKLPREIGARYQYSILGMGLLGNALTARAGKDFDALLKERICAPLKMNATGGKPTPALAAKSAQGHDEYGKSAPSWSYQGLPGVGATWSCADDMLAFLAAQLGISSTPLSAAISRTHILKDTSGMTTGNQFLRVGMGWHLVRRFGSDIYFHNGGGGGFSSFIGFDKNLKKGVVVLANSRNSVTDIGLNILNTQFTAQEYFYKAPITDTLLSVMNAKGIEEAVQVFHKLYADEDYKYDFSEDLLNTFGYELLQEKKIKEAIEVFKLNVELYPKSWNVYDSLGEGYMNAGEKELAIKNYEKSIELNPKNDNGKAILEKLKGN